MAFDPGQGARISIMRIDIRETNGNGDTIPVFESVTWCFNGIYELIALPFNRETEKYISASTRPGTWEHERFVLSLVL